MPSPYGKSLDSVGITRGGNLTQNFIDGYIDDVGNTISQGSSTIQTMLAPFGAPSASALWFTPIDQTSTKLIVEQLKKKDSAWRKTYVDQLLAPIAQALNVQGATPLFPIFDVSSAFPGVDLQIPYTPDQLASKLAINPLELIPKLLGAGLEVSIPIPPIPPIPPLPMTLVPPSTFNIPQPPQVPTIPNTPGIATTLPSLPPIPLVPSPIPALPPLTIVSMLTEMLKLPIDAAISLITQPDLGLFADPLGIPKAIMTIVFKKVEELLKNLGLLNKQNKPSVTLLASILSAIKQIVGMTCVTIVSQILGSGGSISRVGASTFGLVTS